ncbi:uncharacterized protein LOC122665370 isoform X1 [Telopea speciosissima]|uniref:uncharacterized protein LOC122665370 isoform X1 n=1 Tax=Telopea speciosissima TaxID=54955 RepID=UPI001CC7C65B|nr:uncharacterized protein LOC122665370 isoform X1 [Telopea speciosissima]XP_043717435.1 uncharacterized protein LOC122665370 isoform X1 [Telopea speciosissima]
MDYDDNDFQSQSFQLASEENTKFLPGLRSYGLPKFDLDDNLQLHLRFDNLVETEVLLGIQSHEDNQWIEEFSRDGSAIEFSSGAAESCSISRHNNVWSEATSSESVEMLLKSVGQDEMITGHANNVESGACDGVGTLTRVIEPHLDDDSSMPSMLMDDPEVGHALSPKKCQEGFSGVGEQSDPKLLEDETTLQTDEGEKPETGNNSTDLSPGMVGENWILPVDEGNLLLDGRCNEDAVKREDGYLVDGAVEDKVQDNSAASEGLLIDHSVTVMQSFTANVGKLNAQEPQQVIEGCNKIISYECSDRKQNDNIEQVDELGVPSKEPLIDGCSGEENNADVVDSPSKLALSVDSAMPVSDGCSEGECSEQPIQASEREAVVLPKDTEMGDKSLGDKHEASIVVLKGDINFEGQVVEISNRNDVTQLSTILKTDPLVQVSRGEGSVLCFDKQEGLTGDGHSLEGGVSVGNSETTLLINEDSELFKGQCDRSSNNHVGNPSSSLLQLCSSTNVLRESRAAENMKDIHDDSGVHGDDHLANDPHSSSMQVESMQPCESSIVIEHSVLGSQPNLSAIESDNVTPLCECSLVSEPNDVNVLEKENVRIPANSNNMESETNGSIVDLKGDASSSQDQDVVVYVSASDRGVGDESASTGLVSEVINLACYNKLDGVHDLPPGNGSVSNEVMHFTHLDKEEETITEMSREPSSFVMHGCSQMTSEPVPTSELEQLAAHDRAGELLPETLRQSPSSMETVSKGCQNEPQAVMDDKPTQEYSKELEGCASVSNGNDVAEVIGVPHEKCEGASLKFDGTLPSDAEMLMQLVPLPLEESLHGISKEDQEGNKGSLASADNNGQSVLPSSEGDAINGSEISCKPASVSENSSEFCASEAGDSGLNSDVPNCGSPTIISCSEPSRTDNEKLEGYKVSIDQNTSEGLDKEAGGGSGSHDPEGNDAEDDRSFTFKISCHPDLSDRETDERWKPFGNVQPSDFVQAKEVSTPTTSGLSQIDAKTIQESSHASPQASDRENVRGSSKGTAEHKTRRSSSKVTDNGTAKGGRSPKEVTPVKQMKDKGGSPCNMPSSVGVISQALQVEEMRSYSYVEGSARKACSAATAQASSLPDLNSLASPSAMFLQPFTDLQQLQLRAQILVYGSLIQGTAPDEALMISAFGESGEDGGRSRWENAWRTAVERLHIQKSPPSYPETPMLSHSGTRVNEQATRQSTLKIKPFGTPAGRAGNKGTPSAVINPVIPLSSPLWSVTTTSHDALQSGNIPGVPLFDAHQTLSPLHSYQSPHLRHCVGNTTPWFSQAPCPGPWVVSPQTSGLDASAHFPALPITETGHVTSIHESSVPHPSIVQHSPASSVVHSGVTTSVPGGSVLLPEAKRTTSPGKQASSDPRPRKRKKSPASEGPDCISLVPQSQTETISAAVVTNPLPASLAITNPAVSLSKTAAGNSVSTGSPNPSTNYQVIGPQDMEQRIFLDESCSRVEQAKQQAEDSSALAATAVRHSQAIWSQLAIRKNSGLVSDVEAKLAAAAAAAAAAVSVARAAAAAAKVASDAALQAKLMADEALFLSRSGNPSQITEVSPPDGGKNLGMVSPALILEGKDRNNGSGSIIVAAKEASRRRVEAAAAAAKRAENLDAVVKAAELAAKAVSQAGAIVAMGDPIPLTVGELVEAGQDGFWKIHVPSEQKLVKLSNKNQGGNYNLDGVEGLGRSTIHFNEQSSNKRETHRTADQRKPGSPKNMAKHSMESHVGPVDGTHLDSITSNEKSFGRQKGCKTSGVAKTIGVPESEAVAQTDTVTIPDEEHGVHQPVGILDDNSIKEGSLVEVLSVEDGLRRVWFSAKVLSLKDGKAYVCYSELRSNEGSVQLKEWVPLEGEGDKAPRIRIARPMTITKYEGTRKRCRGALVDHNWSVGDRVEAWTLDGWWEGIIMEKRKEDETTFTVHFPAQGDTSIVRAWHLRPYLVWKDGQWVKWSHSTENSSHPQEGDTPKEKRPKLGRHNSDIDPVVEATGEVTLAKCTGTGETVKGGEKVFTVGKNTKEGNTNNSVAFRTKRTGLQMEGPRVIFGVPKPGKKRKFMEVSKHYVAGTGGQSSEGNDSIKIANYLIPQGSGRGWKNTSKVDPKGKRVAEAKPKMLKSGKMNKNLSGKDSFSTPVVPTSNDGTVPMNAKATNGQDGNISKKQSLLEFSSFNGTHKTTEGPTLFSSLAHASDALVSKKKPSPLESTQGGGEGKNATSGEKVAKNEEKDATYNSNFGKSIPDAVEPRRSNRRIQPTSRLLEGLQSSLIVSKIPAVSHDKSTKSHHRSAVASSKGNNH